MRPLHFAKAAKEETKPMKKLSKNQSQKPSTSSRRTSGESDNYLALPNDWRATLHSSGHKATDLEPPTNTGKYIVTFVPKKGAPHINVEMRTIKVEPCPACGTLLDMDGRCRSCWGDIFGLCDVCNKILDEDFECVSCTPNNHVISMD